MSEASFGVYAVDMSQRIIFWNLGAQKILGHRMKDVIGRKCYEVCSSLPVEGSEPICMLGCPSIQLAKEGAIPSIENVRMLCASGERKLVTVTPMVLPLDQESGNNVLIHLLCETQEQDSLWSDKFSENIRGFVGPPGPDGGDEIAILTDRERSVMRLVGLGYETVQIARMLGISKHTVLNHIRNARVKMQANNKLEAVLTALYHGLL